MANDLALIYPYVPVPPLRGGKRGNADEGTTWERRGNGWERVGTGQNPSRITGTGQERKPLICACLSGNAEGTGQIMATKINYLKD